ncbi:MAG: hypothetical protein C0422_04995, partial [Alcaligenaceae bacterium]|nr:hypothetical protein [Alcaligenaceae bacterium]
YNDFFERASYVCKVKTKVSLNSWSCSQLQETREVEGLLPTASAKVAGATAHQYGLAAKLQQIKFQSSRNASNLQSLSCTN